MNGENRIHIPDINRDISDQVTRQQAEIGILKNQIHLLRKEQDDTINGIQQLQEEYKIKTKDEFEMKEHIKQIEGQNKRLEQEKSQLQTENKGHNKRISDLEACILRMGRETEKLKEKNNNNYNMKLCQDYKQIKTTLSDTSNRLADYKQLLKKSNILLDKANQDNASLKQQLESAEKECAKLQAENDKLTANRKEKLETKPNCLEEQVAHFVEEVFEKEKDLPPLGENNIEDCKVQKFINFILLNAYKFKDSVPNGLEGPSELRQQTIENCKICHKIPKFVKCETSTCQSSFHEECIRQWFLTKRVCPCCNQDKIRLNASGNEFQFN